VSTVRVAPDKPGVVLVLTKAMADSRTSDSDHSLNPGKIGAESADASLKNTTRINRTLMKARNME
jgi:hypothetical protein